MEDALDPAAREALRRMARDAYARGDVEEALHLHRKTVASGPPDADDALFMALVLHAARDVDGGIATLRAAVAEFPGHAALHENLAVFLLASGDAPAAAAAARDALALGSASPNVLDCLCEALIETGATDEAIAAGRAALEAKAAMFATRPPLVQVPATAPPPFDPDTPEANVIAYSLWGNQPRYQVPLMENVRILPHLFPAWSIRVYYDDNVDHAFITELQRMGVQTRHMFLPPGQPAHRRLLWRFEAIADPSVKRFLIRDADALLNVKERVAVDAWLRSPFWFHAMRDWYTHTDLILAGMWGGVGGVLPPPTVLFRHWSAWRMENDHIDQDLLSDTVWPAIRSSLLVHDSVFTGTLGAVAFPPYGDLPAGMHIGQNAFVHFHAAG